MRQDLRLEIRCNTNDLVLALLVVFPVSGKKQRNKKQETKEKKQEHPKEITKNKCKTK